MNPLIVAKSLSIRENVCINVIDQFTGELISQHIGHNTATNSLLYGMAHYLIGDGVLGQGYTMLSKYIPQYISLGTMGLYSQDEDDDGLPSGVGLGSTSTEEENFIYYFNQRPGYGADGYDLNDNNSRLHAGLGPKFSDRESENSVDCELISDTFCRQSITFRDVVPETESELPRTIDIVFSAMIPTGGFKQFRESGKDYIFITEAGLWSTKTWSSSSENGLLAGYRILPPNEDYWDMTDPDNRQIVKENILKVGINQVVQVIWKIQIGSLDDLGYEPTPTPTTDWEYPVYIGTHKLKITQTNTSTQDVDILNIK